MFRHVFLHCQYHVLPQAPYLMDKNPIPAQYLGAESSTPVTQGTGWLQVAPEEHVSQMVSGQGVIQHVDVSSHSGSLSLEW